MENKQFRYHAFISYSRKDEKWAKQLQKKLEHYKLPSIIRKEENNQLPQNLRPIFRDKTDIGIGKIVDTLKQELEESRCLIVICSPNSAKSEWVNREIEYFKELGKEEQIIPFIVEGTPDTTDETKQCYPPALSADMLGASVEELGSDKAFVKVVASMLELKFDQLWNRHHRRKTQKRKLSISVSILSLSLLLIGGIWLWNYYTPKTIYYSDYVERYGIPEGIRELSSEEVSKREASYRFIYQQGLLRRMSRVNSVDRLREHNDSEHMEHPNDMKLYYTPEQKLDYADYIDRNGKILYRKDYNPKLNAVTFRHADEFNTEFSLSGRTTQTFNYAFSTNKSNKGQITRHLLTYDEYGFVQKILFAKYQNNPATDMDGIHGQIFKRDEKGRVVEVQFIGLDGKPKNNKVGLGMKRYSYNERDDWEIVSYHDKNGDLSQDDIGISLCSLYYDNWGNRIKEAYFDTEMEPILRSDMYVHSMEYSLDENGNRVAVHYIGNDQKKCLSMYGIAGMRSEYDDMCNEIVRYFVNLEEEMVYSTDGNAKSVMSYDDKGNYDEIWFYDVNDELCFLNTGIAGETYKRDSVGNIISYRCYGTDKKLYLKKDGTSGYDASFDERGNIIELINIGIDGKPAGGNNLITTWRATFDRRGNKTEISFYDQDNKACLSGEDIAGWRSKYDDAGNEIEREFFCLEDKPCPGNIGYTGWVAEYDEQGNKTQQLYKNEKGQVDLCSDGYAGWKSKFDSKGNVLETIYLNEKQMPSKRYYITRFKYDQNDNTIEKLYFDEEGNEAILTDGHFGWQAEYDNKNNITKKVFIDKSFKPINIAKGYAYYTASINDKGNEDTVKYFDSNGKPAKNENGVSVVNKEYDATNNLIAEKYFTASGEPAEDKNKIHSKQMKYDIFGRIIFEAAFDKSLKATPFENSCVQKRLEYDLFGNIIKTSYFDETNNLADCDLGYAVLQKQMNHRGEVLEQSFLNKDKEPTLYEGYYRFSRDYDEKGNITEIRLYGTDNTLLKKSYAVVIHSYNDVGKQIKTEYFDHNRKLTNYSKDYPFCSITYVLDKKGETKLKQYYRLDGSIYATLDANGNRVYSDEEVCDYIKSVPVPFMIVDGLRFTKSICGKRAAYYSWELTEWALSSMTDEQVQQITESVRSIAESYDYVKTLQNISSPVYIDVVDAEGKKFASYTF